MLYFGPTIIDRSGLVPTGLNGQGACEQTGGISYVLLQTGRIQPSVHVQEHAAWAEPASNNRADAVINGSQVRVIRDTHLLLGTSTERPSPALDG